MLQVAKGNNANDLRKDFLSIFCRIVFSVANIGVTTIKSGKEFANCIKNGQHPLLDADHGFLLSNKFNSFYEQLSRPHLAPALAAKLEKVGSVFKCAP